MGDRDPPSPPGNSQAAIGFPRNVFTDPLEKQLELWDLWVQLLLEGGLYGPL